MTVVRGTFAALLLLVVLPAVGARGQPVRLFTFGTPEAITRPGFTRVTPRDTFTPERGFGFETTRGLLAFDRGGANVERPADDYTFSAYGAYRTTSDLTAALIEGQSDNAFLVALPDGEYTVWLVASDAEWDPPLFEVRANGLKKLDVRIPRRAFVFMEPFRARAVGGRLRIALKGRHGWILSALLIGRDGAELHDAVARAGRDIFFLTDQELPNWKARNQVPANPPLRLAPAERARGYVVFPADPCEPITPTYAPPRAAVGKPLTAFATPGEFEPATLGIAASRDLGRVKIELSDLVEESTKHRIPRHSVSLGIVRCRPMRVTGEGPKGEYEVAPGMIESPDGRDSAVRAGETRQWWLTVHVPDDAPPGRYRATLSVRPVKAASTAVEWRLLVLPFRLIRPAGKHWGTWLESFPPVGGLSGPERRGRNTPGEQARLARADLADYRDHGFDLALFNYYFGVDERPDGSFVYDLSGLARDMAYWKAMGSSAPVVICCEYAFRDIEHRFAEAGKEHIEGAFSPRARRAIVGLVQAIRDEARRRGWPKLYFAPIDEPGNSKTANRMRFAENVLGFVHEVPGCQTATTISASELQRLGDRVDARIYADGNFSPAKARREAARGHPFWFYNNGMFYGHSTMASRSLPGFYFLRSGASVATAWGFDAAQANPENDFDGGHRDWNVVLPGVDALRPSIYWELCREGVDDCRYVATLREQIREARARGRLAAARRAEQVLAPLVDPDAPEIDAPRAFGRYRWRIAREILALRGDRRLAVPFAAVMRDRAPGVRPGPNVIADPSFESGPQADGFPTGGYIVSDQYAQPEVRPVGALSVTEETAHSGRCCLKWDFGKAEGKGSVYGRDRWLIVNVQVPPDVARGLRGKRVRVGYWFRLGGGAAVPGMTLRQFGKGEFLGGLSYAGGIEDPAVWNHFVTEGRLRDDYEGLDIHISCPIPNDPEQARKALFYIDDVSLQAIEDPPVAISSPLDEYYVGEVVPWSVRASSPRARVKMALRAEQRLVAEQAGHILSGLSEGAFATRALKPGIYTLEALCIDATGARHTARRSFALSPDPFDWSGRAR